MMHDIQLDLFASLPEETEPERTHCLAEYVPVKADTETVYDMDLPRTVPPLSRRELLRKKEMLTRTIIAAGWKEGHPRGFPSPFPAEMREGGRLSGYHRWLHDYNVEAIHANRRHDWDGMERWCDEGLRLWDAIVSLYEEEGRGKEFRQWEANYDA